MAGLHAFTTVHVKFAWPGDDAWAADKIPAYYTQMPAPQRAISRWSCSEPLCGRVFLILDFLQYLLLDYYGFQDVQF